LLINYLFIVTTVQLSQHHNADSHRWYQLPQNLAEAACGLIWLVQHYVWSGRMWAYIKSKKNGKKSAKVGRSRIVSEHGEVVSEIQSGGNTTNSTPAASKTMRKRRLAEKLPLIESKDRNGDGRKLSKNASKDSTIRDPSDLDSSKSSDSEDDSDSCISEGDTQNPNSNTKHANPETSPNNDNPSNDDSDAFPPDTFWTKTLLWLPLSSMFGLGCYMMCFTGMAGITPPIYSMIRGSRLVWISLISRFITKSQMLYLYQYVGLLVVFVGKGKFVDGNILLTNQY
jgi:hypothetical protein